MEVGPERDEQLTSRAFAYFFQPGTPCTRPRCSAWGFLQGVAGSAVMREVEAFETTCTLIASATRWPECVPGLRIGPAPSYGASQFRATSVFYVIPYVAFSY